MASRDSEKADQLKKTKPELARELNGWRRKASQLEKKLAEAECVEESLRKRTHQLTRDLRKIKQSQTQTIQRERLHALGQMASGIVHDFNNALTPILGASDFLLGNPEMLKNTDMVLSLLGSVRTAGRDARNMIRHLRGFYRPEEDLELHIINMNPLIDQVISLTQLKWKQQAQARGVTIAIKTDLREVAPVAMNESHFREVLTNIVLNSVDAMPNGGTIRIFTRNKKDMVQLTVEDSGMGMTEEVRQRCFEPFFSTKGKDGTGMGLAMTYGVIRKYDGIIEIESEEGVGTAITILLPASKEDLKTDTDSDSRVANSSGGPLRVLVVDDDPPSREIITTCLVADGHSVDNASSSKEAVDKVEVAPYDVVFLDILMPDMSGLELAAIIKKKVPTAGIIVVTGSIDFPESEVDSSHLDLILGKPVTQDDLRKALNGIVALRRATSKE